jgi:hypothetical protein
VDFLILIIAFIIALKLSKIIIKEPSRGDIFDNNDND